MPILGTIITVANLTNLAKALYESWRSREENHGHQLEIKLEEARARHVQALEEARELAYQRRIHDMELRILDSSHTINVQRTVFSVPQSLPVVLEANSPLLRRLQQEAEELAAMNYEVIYECVDDGYGLALPIASDVLVGFVIPPNYPDRAPLVLVKHGSALEQVPFGQDSWYPEFHFSIILAQLMPVYVSDQLPGPETGPGMADASLMAYDTDTLPL